RESDGAHGPEIRLAARLPAGDGYRVARFQRLAAPALANEHVRREALEAPLGNGAVLTLHLDREVNVRIDPFHARDGAGQRHGLLAVEDRGERVVGLCGAGREECRHEDETRPAKSHFWSSPEKLVAARRVCFRPSVSFK